PTSGVKTQALRRTDGESLAPAESRCRAPRSPDRLGIETEADPPKLLNLVAQPRRFLELEVARMAIHLLLELLDLREHVLRADLHARRRAAVAAFALARASARRRARAFHDVLHALADRLRLDPMGLVIGDLLLATPVRLVDRALHGARDAVRVKDRLAVHVPSGPADRLDQRSLRAQEAFLIGVEDRDERDLRHVEPLTQQVDADEHVELAEPEIADDLGALDGIDVRVQVPHPHA